MCLQSQAIQLAGLALHRVHRRTLGLWVGAAAAGALAAAGCAGGAAAAGTVAAVAVVRGC